MGKSSSKLKNRRSQSIAWSFRFSNFRKKHNAMMVSICPNLGIIPWLDILDLRQYEELFAAYTEVIELIHFRESDIKQLGVRNSAHRARIVSSLVALREKHSKYNKKSSIQNRSNQRHSYAMGTQKSETTDSAYASLNVVEQKQSKSLGDLLEMEPTNAEEVLALRKVLEWELSLDSRDLRSHAWYHGAIPRQRAEEIVQHDGDFLVRDCASQPGNYVLTCRSKGPVLHFVINKLLIQPETVYERVQYQFEDDAYDTVPDLITFYVGSGKAISLASGSRIQFPCNRMYPLSFYTTKYGATASSAIVASPLNSPLLANAGIRSPMSSPPRTKRDTPPKLPSKKQRPILVGIQSNSADSVIQGSSSEISNATLERSLEHKKLGSAEKCNSADGMIQTKSKIDNNNMTRSVEEKSTSADGIIHHSTQMSRSSGDSLAAGHNKFQSLQRIQSASSAQISHRMMSGSTKIIHRDMLSDQALLSPCLEKRQQSGCDDDDGNDVPSPPPKPHRAQSFNRAGDNSNSKDNSIESNPLNRIVLYHQSGSDSGNGSGDSAQSSAAGDPVELVQHRGGVIIKNPRFIPNSASSATLRSVPDIDYSAAEDALLALNIPLLVHPSCFDTENFTTLLLPSIENKPLDNEALNTFRVMISETGPRILANHLTRVDIKLILGNFVDASSATASTMPGPGIALDVDSIAMHANGLELLTLSHGEQFRKDLIERTECIKLLVAITILTCADDLERAETLNKWIQIAIDTKTALGNLFGFCAIMLGLCMPQIQKLESTWHMLRQKYTDSAFNFEAKLRPTLKSMNDCSNPQAPNTTIPHLLPYILLRDRTIENILGMTAPAASNLISSCITPWENSAADFGLTIMYTHLDGARNFAKNLSLYQRNAQLVMKDSSSRLDELLEDAFRTEFHIKFLWGSKGALSQSTERHTKMEQIVTLMAEKFCNTSKTISTAA